MILHATCGGCFAFMVIRVFSKQYHRSLDVEYVVMPSKP